MRLHTLEMTAFGPYAAPQRIDFDLLAGSGLFLLEGPTGAGKSTVLDAITFALYGGLAGQESAEDRLRSHFAGPTAEPRVTLEFSVAGTRYRITRVPEHRRPKRRGDGFTTQASQVHLERMEGGRWSSLSANKAEAGDLVTTAVGLNRAQFTQVMLLPQGEFARFLRASDDDRRQLLTKLFGTGLYDRVTAELERRRTEAKRLIEDAERAVADAVSAAAEAAGLDGQARAELHTLASAERDTVLKEAAAAIAEAVAVTGAGLEAASGALTAARTAAEQAKEQAAAMTRLTQALAGLRAHEGTRPGHDARAGRLDQARRAEPVRPLLAALAETDSAVGTAQDAVRTLNASPDAAMLEGRGGGDATARSETAERNAAELQHLADREAGLAATEQDLAALDVVHSQASTQAAALADAREELPGRITRLEGELAEAQVVAARHGDLLSRQDALTRQRDAAIGAAELGPQVATAKAALQAAVDAHQAGVDEYQRLMQERLEGMAAELAARIAEGGPCPVCGSMHHPAPACAAAGAVSADDVEAAAARRDQASQERDRLEAEHSGLATQEAAAAALAGGRTIGELDAELASLAGEISGAEQAQADAEGLAADLDRTRTELETGDADLRAAEKQATAARAKADAARAALASLRAELAEAAGDYPCVAARQTALRDAAAKDMALAGALNQLAAALAEQMKAGERAGREVCARGFASLDQARAAVAGPDEQVALDKEIQSWTAELARLQAAAEADDLAGLDPGEADAVHARAATDAAALTRAQEDELQVRGKHEEAKTRGARLDMRLAELARAGEAHDLLAAESGPVITLAGLAKGTEGHRRMSLTTYVLRYWFSQVAAAANVRLSAMSAGRYELARTDEGETKRERTGLTLTVIDRHTGVARSPASLSGGETFYTSLALALGLADVVRAEAGGVDLDTLFIDEGFGSLDADTLDQVMAVIDDLRDRGRVVGIVSHLADLKDRVPERLEVRRLPDGSSAVRVVA